jgi:hypothetical protein
MRRSGRSMNSALSWRKRFRTTREVAPYMAKITITVEDIANDKVQIVATPGFAEMMGLEINGSGLTPAHGYALRMLNEAMKLSRSQDPTNLIQIPKIRRAH